MAGEVTTDERVFKIRYRTFIPMLVAIIITTNTATSLILNVGQNSDQIEYDKGRSDRRDSATKEEAMLYTDIKFLELEIILLKEKLKECKDGVQPRK